MTGQYIPPQEGWSCPFCGHLVREGEPVEGYMFAQDGEYTTLDGSERRPIGAGCFVEGHTNCGDALAVYRIVEPLCFHAE